jgi:hypothetical protein
MDQASSVYGDLASGSLGAVGVLLEYPAPAAEIKPRETSRVVSTTAAPAARSGTGGKLAIGFIGAGNYASSCCCRAWRLANAIRTSPPRSLSA